MRWLTLAAGPLVASALAVAACTGGPGPLPDDQTGGSGSDERSPTSVENPGQSAEDPSSGDDDTGSSNGNRTDAGASPRDGG